MFRYTNKELEERTDYEMLRCICVERQSTLTNTYSPLYKRLNALQCKLDSESPLSMNGQKQANLHDELVEACGEARRLMKQMIIPMGVDKAGTKPNEVLQMLIAVLAKVGGK